MRKTILIIMAALIVFSLITVTQAFGKAEVTAPQNVFAMKNSSNSIKVQWAKDKNAKRFIVYRYYPKTRKLKKVGETKKTYFVSGGLTDRKVKYYKVQSITAKGKSKLSRYVAVKNWSKKSKTANIGQVKLNKKTLTVNLLENPTYKPIDLELTIHVLKARVSSSAKGKKPFSKKVRWISDNKKVARVTSNGKIVPVSEGQCKIRAVAQTGKKSAAVLVKVKDYANVKKFSGLPKDAFETDVMETMAHELLIERRKELCEVVSYFEKQPVTRTMFLKTDISGGYSSAGISNDEKINNAISKLRDMPYRIYIAKDSKGEIVVRYGIIDEPSGFTHDIVPYPYSDDGWLDLGERQMIRAEYIMLKYPVESEKYKVGKYWLFATFFDPDAYAVLY